MSIYSFEPGPKYRPLTPQAAWDSALSSPLSLGTNFGEQVVGGALQSYVLGSTIRDTLIPQGNVERSPLQIIDALTPGIGMAKEAVRGLTQNFINPDQPSLSEDEWKASPSYRENIPYDPGMTAARADALAAWDDARKVREHFASKRPFSSFVGNLGGQALDPVNYVPVFGELVRAAALAKVGRIAGAALVASGDAAANTALAAAATYDTRGSFGDEVSWQGTISEIATAALIGGAFGTIGGAVGARSDARAVREATDRLSTLRTTQEARIALNEAIDGIVSGEDIRLSPNSTEPMAVAADAIKTEAPDRWDFATYAPKDIADNTLPAQVFHGTSRGEFDQFDPYSGEYGLMGAGSYFTEDPKIAAEYTTKGKGSTPAVYETKLDIKNAMDMDAPANVKSWRDSFADYLPTEDWDQRPISYEGKTNEQMYRDVEDALSQEAIPRYEGAEIMQDGLRNMGHDGVTHIGGGRHKDSKGVKHRVWIAFDPEQVSVLRKITPKEIAPTPIDTSPARPDPIPEGRAKAEAALAKTETYKATAEQYRVDPETGSYVEEAEIKQLEIEGRLTAQDKADLEAAAQIHENGVAYGDALKAAVNCLI